MALELTAEQEKVLLAMIDREAAALTASAAVVTAQAALDALEAQWMAERAVADQTHHDAIHTINAAWGSTIADARAALETAKAAETKALEPIDSKALAEVVK